MAKGSVDIRPRGDKVEESPDTVAGMGAAKMFIAKTSITRPARKRIFMFENVMNFGPAD